MGKFSFLVPLFCLATFAFGEPRGDIGFPAPRWRLTGHADAVMSLDWSGDGRRLVTASADKTARIWDMTTGKCLHVLGGANSAFVASRISRDGTTVVLGSVDRSASVWDVATGEQRAWIRFGEHVHHVAICDDGSRFAVASCNGESVVFETATEREVARMRASTESRAVAMNADGSLVAALFESKAEQEPEIATLFVYEVPGGRILH